MDIIAINRLLLIIYVILTNSETRILAMDDNSDDSWLQLCKQDAVLRQQINVCASNFGQRIDLNVFQTQTTTNVNYTICTGNDSKLFEWSKSEMAQLSLKSDVQRSKEGEFAVKIVISSGDQTLPIFSVFLVKVNVSEVFCASNWPELLPVKSQYCTVVIALLASVCLILLTAFALTFIVLRKNRLLLLSSKQPLDHESASNPRNNGFVTPRKASTYDLQSSPNGRINHRIDALINSEQFPRKSSLKSTRIWDTSETERDGGHSNNAFAGDNDSVDKKSDQSPDMSAEPRRKSVVTFNDTTEVIRIAANSQKK